MALRSTVPQEDRPWPAQHTMYQSTFRYFKRNFIWIKFYAILGQIELINLCLSNQIVRH